VGIGDLLRRIASGGVDVGVAVFTEDVEELLGCFRGALADNGVGGVADATCSQDDLDRLGL
jgi:hypothetical protein